MSDETAKDLQTEIMKLRQAILNLPTRREYFAAAVLQGMYASITQNSDWPDTHYRKVWAEHAFSQADAVLIVRDQKIER